MIGAALTTCLFFLFLLPGLAWAESGPELQEVVDRVLAAYSRLDSMKIEMETTDANGLRKSRICFVRPNLLSVRNRDLGTGSFVELVANGTDTYYSNSSSSGHARFSKVLWKSDLENDEDVFWLPTVVKLDSGSKTFLWAMLPLSHEEKYEAIWYWLGPLRTCHLAPQQSGRLVIDIEPKDSKARQIVGDFKIRLFINPQSDLVERVLMQRDGKAIGFTTVKYQAVKHFEECEFRFFPLPNGIEEEPIVPSHPAQPWPTDG